MYIYIYFLLYKNLTISSTPNSHFVHRVACTHITVEGIKIMKTKGLDQSQNTYKELKLNLRFSKPQ